MADSQGLYQRWLQFPGLEEGLRKELLAIGGDDEQINDRFYRSLSFGTGGLRGKMGAGTNRMNIYTVLKASKGLAKYLTQKSDLPSCAIAYDSRNDSARYARVTAAALAEKGVRVYLFSELAPTPMCSFAVRYLKCDGGVVITASHNPAQYNGYKVYDKHGCQITDEAAADISALIAKQQDLVTRLADYAKLQAEGMIRLIDRDVRDAYQQAVLALSVRLPATPLKVVYSPLNGAGNRPVRQVLGALPNVQVTVVPEQELPDGNFPTCPRPNPEYPETMALAAAAMMASEADICLATDPDGDRLGVGLRTKDGPDFLTGNELGVLLLHFICESRLARGTLPEHPVAVKTIVTTPMAEAVASHYGVQMINVLTGFKYIGATINRLKREGQEGRFILGFEESYGYLSGTHVRDKDAVNAALLVCEMASFYLGQHMTLRDAWRALRERFGVYESDLLSFTFEGQRGQETMRAVMSALRSADRAAGYLVEERIDYLQGSSGLPAADVLRFRLAGDREMVVRPSGTEPLLKLYLHVRQGQGEDAGRKLDELRLAARSMIEQLQ
ncbi:MAG: phospho-sugar mutase [Christensenellales bacterium]